MAIYKRRKGPAAKGKGKGRARKSSVAAKRGVAINRKRGRR